MDKLLADDAVVSRIDDSRIGVAGFSAGGYTGLALAGAIISSNKQQQFCNQNKADPVCELIELKMFHDSANKDAHNSLKDTRIKAVFAMAPAMGTAVEISRLNEITIPVFITASEDDTFLNPDLHAKIYAQNISGAQLSMIPAGGHFVFSQCTLLMHEIQLFDDFAKEYDLCGHNSEVKRENVWREVANLAVNFFNKSL